MNWLAFANFFAGPLTTLLNKAIGAGAASLITWQVAHGVGVSDATTIASAAALAISTAISMAIQTQPAKIQSVNAEPNGVKVVAANVPGHMETRPLH